MARPGALVGQRHAGGEGLAQRAHGLRAHEGATGGEIAGHQRKAFLGAAETRHRFGGGDEVARLRLRHIHRVASGLRQRIGFGQQQALHGVGGVAGAGEGLRHIHQLDAGRGLQNRLRMACGEIIEFENADALGAIPRDALADEGGRARGRRHLACGHDGADPFGDARGQGGGENHLAIGRRVEQPLVPVGREAREPPDRAAARDIGIGDEDIDALSGEFGVQACAPVGKSGSGNLSAVPGHQTTTHGVLTARERRKVRAACRRAIHARRHAPQANRPAPDSPRRGDRCWDGR